MNSSVVADASLAVKWLIVEEDSGKAAACVRHFQREGTLFAAPCLTPVKAANVLHRHVARRELAVGAAASLLRNLMNARVELHEIS